MTKNNFKYFATGILLFINSNLLVACSCMGPYEDDFFKAIEGYDYVLEIYFGQVVWAEHQREIRGDRGDAALVRVTDTLGNVSNVPGDSILLVGQNGWNCGDDIYFSEGQFLAFALMRMFGQDTFLLPTCARHYAFISDGIPDEETIDDWKMKIWNSISSSYDANFQEVGVFPNPVNNYLFIKGEWQKNATIEVYNMMGQKVNESVVNLSANLPLQVHHLRPDLYRIIIRHDDKIYSSSFVKSD